MRKCNVIYDEIKYFYSENKTICKLTFSVDIMPLKCFVNTDVKPAFILNIMPTYKKILKDMIGIDIYFSNLAKPQFTIYGKSKLHKNDINNKVLGENIALTRAQEKAFSISERLFKAILKDITNIYNNYDRMVTYNTISKNQCKNHIKELIK